MGNPLEDFFNRPGTSFTVDPAFLLYQQVLAEAPSGGSSSFAFAGKAFSSRSPEGTNSSYPFLITQDSAQVEALSSGLLQGTMHQLGVVPTSIDGTLLPERELSYERRAFPELPSSSSSSSEGTALIQSPPASRSPYSPSDPDFVLRYAAKYDPQRNMYLGILGRPGKLTRIELRRRYKFELKKIDLGALIEGSPTFRALLR